MRDRPKITTAIPQARYRLGSYSATLLGDIESGDGHQYRYILAFVANGCNEPSLYLCSERHGDPSQPRLCDLRLISEALSETLDRATDWADLETFGAKALELGQQALGLRQERIERLF